MSITISGSSGIVGANGSASAPALTGADIDTGIFFPEANVVAFSTGSVESFRANANGIFATANVNVTNLTTTNLTATNVIPTSSYLRNRIINGDMRIDQRNAGASVTPTVTSLYTLDRWSAQLSVTSKYSIQQNAGSVTPPVGFTNYLGATSLSAYSVGSSEGFGIRHIIEGYNVADLAWGTANAKSVTLSFWVYSSLTGTFGGSLRNGASDRSYVFSYNISSSNTWTQISITISGDTTGTWLTSNQGGLILYFSLGTGSTISNTAGSWTAGNYTSVTGAVSVVGTSGATFYVTGVQLEVGSVATPFERRQYGHELSLCQRYYQRIGDDTVVLFSGNTTTGSDFYQCYTLQTEMRTSPTATRVGTWTLGNTTTQPTFVATSKMFRVNSQITATGQGYVQAGTGIYVSFNAEL